MFTSGQGAIGDIKIFRYEGELAIPAGRLRTAGPVGLAESAEVPVVPDVALLAAGLGLGEVQPVAPPFAEATRAQGRVPLVYRPGVVRQDGVAKADFPWGRPRG